MKKLILLFILSSFVSILSAFGQSREIKGKIIDAADKSPIVGVTVQLVGNNSTYAISDVNGEFKINVPNSVTTLKFTNFGYKENMVNISQADYYQVIMSADAIALSEVVVTALGISREKKTLGYSIQEVGSEELNVNKSSNIINTLHGKVAGVQITQGSSSLGSSSRIVIRGNGGFSGNSPLWVVDGVPVNSNTTSISGAGGIDYGDAIADLDANNIESMTVLKGASASALYGSRAINGVIVVTTKKGKGKSRGVSVDFNSSFVANMPTYFPKLQQQYGSGSYGDEYSYNTRTDENGNLLKDKYSSYNDYANNESYRWVDGMNGLNEGAVSWGARLDAGLLVDQWASGKNSPWVSRPDNLKYWFDTGFDVENNIAISAVGDKAFGRLSYTNLSSTGVIPYTSQYQNTITTSVTLNPIKNLTVKADITYLRKNSDNLKSFGYEYADIYAWRGVEYDVKHLRDIYEKDKLNQCEWPNSDNRFWSLDNMKNSFYRERIYGNVTASYQFTKWLSASARFGTDSYSEQKKYITPSTSWGQITRNKNGNFSMNNFTFREDNVDVFINFDKTFGKFRVDGMLGGNYLYRNYHSEWMSAPDLVVPDLYVMSNVNGTPGVGNSMTKEKSYSVFFAVNGSYDDWLFLGVTGRNDWSSTLPSNNRSYFYPALNLSFSITDAFDIKSDILTYAKPRFNIAQVGGATSPYRLQEVYGMGKWNGTAIMYPSLQYPPVDLKPQMATSWEVGADVRLFKGKLSLDLTYYQRTTRDMIMNVPLSTPTGYSSMLINAGKIQNNGVEVMANWIIFENKKGFNWDVTLNWAHNRSMIKELYPGINSYRLADGYTCPIMAIPGKEWGLLFGEKYARTEDGQIINDKNGFPKMGGSGILGRVTPLWTGGLQLNLGYKGFSVGALFDVNYGNQFFSVTKWHSYPTGAYNNTVKGGVRENGVIGEGVLEVFDDGGNVIGYKPNDIRMSAERYYSSPWVWNNREYSVLDGSYIKFRELTVSYSHRFKEKYAIKGLRVSFVARNLAILYRSAECRELGIDPETQFGGTEAGMGIENFNLPGTISMGAKVNLQF